MNDLDFAADLRAALHRDSDLAGEPSADLLDQLDRRRQHQRRQRLALLGAVAAVVVIAAGIPVGVSRVARSDTAPATQPAVPTPSVTPEVSPSSVRTTASEASPSTSAPTTNPVAGPPLTSAGASPAVPPAPACPTGAQLVAVMPGQSSTHWFSPIQPDYVRCSGGWAVAFLQNNTVVEGEHHETGYTALYEYVRGSWTQVDRGTDCPIAGRVPSAIYSDACETD